MLLMQERVQVCVDVMHRLPDRQRADTAENCNMPACQHASMPACQHASMQAGVRRV
jgi:hypothetical protein